MDDPYDKKLFWSMVEPEEYPCDCRLWLGQWKHSGHGIWITSPKKHRMTGSMYQDAYRAAFEFAGKRYIIGAKFHVAHLCGLAPCCNPHHLRAVSPEQNAFERREHRRVLNAITENQRAAIRTSGLSFKEVSRVMHIPGGVAFRILHGDLERRNYPVPLISVYRLRSVERAPEPEVKFDMSRLIM